LWTAFCTVNMGALARLLPVHRSVQADYVGIAKHQFEQKHPTSSFLGIPFGDGPRHNSIRYTLFKHPHKFSMLGKPSQQCPWVEKTPITCSHQNPKKCKSSTLKRVLITGATSTRVSRGRKFQRTASQWQHLPCFAYKTCPTEHGPVASPFACAFARWFCVGLSNMRMSNHCKLEQSLHVSLR